MTESEHIDLLLADRQNGDFFAMAQLNPEQKSAAYKMIALDLISSRGNVYDIGEKGCEVIKAGGFDNWITEREKRENEAHQATLDTANATVDAALHPSILNTLLLLVLVYTAKRSQNENSSIKC